MCFSQSSLYCCQRRWSGYTDRAMVHSLGIFYRLFLNHGKFFAVFIWESRLWTSTVLFMLMSLLAGKKVMGLPMLFVILTARGGIALCYYSVITFWGKNTILTRANFSLQTATVCSWARDVSPGVAVPVSRSISLVQAEISQPEGRFTLTFTAHRGWLLLIARLFPFLNQRVNTSWMEWHEI